MRLKEAAKLGFARALCPAASSEARAGVRPIGVARLADAVARLEGGDWGGP